MPDNRNISDEEFFHYMDRLRESGVTNMYDSPRWLIREFDIPMDQARGIFLRWSEYRRALAKTQED